MTNESYKTHLISINSTFIPLEDFKGVEYKISHVCKKGHIRSIAAASVIAGGGCAVCSGVVRKTTEEYEKELFDKALPFKLCSEYYSCMTKAKHQCLECDNIWEVKPHDILHGSGCPKCAKQGFNPYRPAMLYYVRLTNPEGLTFYKIGVTGKKTVTHRFRAENLKVELLWEKHFDNVFPSLDHAYKLPRNHQYKLSLQFQRLDFRLCKL